MKAGFELSSDRLKMEAWFDALPTSTDREKWYKWSCHHRMDEFIEPATLVGCSPWDLWLRMRYARHTINVMAADMGLPDSWGDMDVSPVTEQPEYLFACQGFTESLSAGILPVDHEFHSAEDAQTIRDLTPQTIADMRDKARARLVHLKTYIESTP